MPVIAEESRSLEWGLLLIADPADRAPIPPWSSDAGPVTSTESSILVRVLPRDEGDVKVTVTDDPVAIGNQPGFSGSLLVVLVVGDAVQSGLLIRCGPGHVRVSVATNDEETPTVVMVGIEGASAVGPPDAARL
jgi:hypothetical protein